MRKRLERSRAYEGEERGRRTAEERKGAEQRLILYSGKAIGKSALQNLEKQDSTGDVVAMGKT